MGRGKHLDVLGPVDRAFIGFNKFSTCFFTYHTLRFCWLSSSVKWVSARQPILLLPSALALLSCSIAQSHLL